MIDLVVIAVYLVGCIVAGVVYGGRQASTSDYFAAGGSMRGWFNSTLVGLSIAATFFSGISFLMLPSVIFGGGAVLVLTVVSFPVAWVVLRFWFLPRYLSGPADQRPYDVLERRFGPTVRTTAAVMYLLLRVGWMATLIYAPTIAIIGAWQLDAGWFWPIVLVIGIGSTIYTVLGGLRGVIFTDALQLVVILAGIVAVLAVILWNLPTSLGAGLRDATAQGVFASFDLSLNLQQMTVWAVVVGAIVNNLGSYIADQMSLQRYLASDDRRDSNRAFLVNAVGATAVVLLLAVVGVALKVWYLSVPDANLPADTDKVFPYFIATQLPVGITGLIVAAVLAATMSSITSGVNTLAAVVVLDLRARFGSRQHSGDAAQLRFSRMASLVIGVASTFAAGVVSKLGSIFDIVMTVLGATGGPLFACVVLSVTSLRVAPGAMLAGLLIGPLAGWMVARSSLNNLWVGPVSFTVCALLAVGLSRFRRGDAAYSLASEVVSAD